MKQNQPQKSQIQIRPLGVNDYKAVVDLWQRSGLPSRPQGRDSKEAFAEQLASGVQTVLGLEKNNLLIGVVIATHDGRKGWINRLAVAPGHRRKGHGKRLIAAAEEALKAQGIHVIAALITKQNDASLTLFQQEGYELADYIYYLSKRDSARA